MSKKKHTKRKTASRIVLIVIAAILLLSAVVVGMCLFNERPAVQAVATYQSAYFDTIINVDDDGGVEILPQNKEDAKIGLIFYVGAQIKPNAYIPLLAQIAEQGYVCFIPNLTFNMAALEPLAAEEIISAHPEIKSWVLAGHSMGGLTASGFADDHRDTIDGLILIAAYTNRDMSDAELPTLAIFGDTDGVMNKSLYEKRKAWNPADFEEYIITGANHAQYGDYGKQPRDNDATITAEEQQKQTSDMILDWLSRNIAGKEHLQ
ncbi:MAG: alpha/beta hydrolase [Clostridiales bacterium]|nr:alpha/beta hydrolase [Candidatus Cacconaster stercorequi]